MKVLTVIITQPHVSRGSGAINAAFELTKELSKYVDIEISIMSDRDRITSIDGLQVHFANSFEIFKSIGKKIPAIPQNYFNSLVLTSITKKIKRGAYDLIHLHNFHPVAAATQVALKCLSRSVPYVVSTHGLVEFLEWGGETRGYEDKSNPILEFIFKIVVQYPVVSILRKAKAVAALSEHDRTVLKYLGIKGDKIAVVNNGVNPYFLNCSSSTAIRAIERKYSIERGEAVILSMGITLNKGLHFLIRTLPLLQERFKLLIVGKPRSNEYYRYLLKLVRIWHLENRILFTGHVSEEELRSLYHRADIFVLPTLADTFPLCILEAMASRTAVIATEVGGIPEQVTNKTGILVPPKNCSKLAQAITELLVDSKLRKSMGEKGFERVQEKFSWRNAAKKTFEMYNNVVGK